MSKFRNIFQKNQVKIDIPKIKGQQLSEKKLLLMIDKYNGIICGDDILSARVLKKAKKLKVIIKWGTGLDAIDIKQTKKLNIPVYNTPDAFTEPVSDTTIAFMLAFARNILELDRSMKKGKWQKIQGNSLSEKTLGIIGLGNIGQAVARKAHSFGTRILGYDIKKVPKIILKKYNIKMVNKEKLLSKSDYISLNCALTKDTYHLITKKEFKLMRPNAVIINTARGALIKEDDLVEAIKKRYIAGAALDVFEKEPLSKNSPLRKFDNVILSPHNANSSPYYYQKVHENSIKKLFEGLNIK
ncbi:hypothetical protein AMJ49_04235 [Parcubacteria bacterium DG_74_2]|nr:MAG: hypothetical protein AMJ49_04235 [Parcubacteria bacterium DG_74_2]